jgi:hypothetical protein
MQKPLKWCLPLSVSTTILNAFLVSPSLLRNQQFWLCLFQWRTCGKVYSFWSSHDETSPPASSFDTRAWDDSFHPSLSFRIFNLQFYPRIPCPIHLYPRYSIQLLLRHAKTLLHLAYIPLLFSLIHFPPFPSSTRSNQPVHMSSSSDDVNLHGLTLLLQRMKLRKQNILLSGFFRLSLSVAENSKKVSQLSLIFYWNFSFEFLISYLCKLLLYK